MRKLLPLLLMLGLASAAHAQNWTGILDGTRAMDWRNSPGVTFVIPSGSWTQCGSTIAAYTGSTAAINTAIAACGSNQYVLLGPGLFSMTSGCINWQTKSFVELRGSGPMQTRVVFSSNGCGGFSGQTDVRMAPTIFTFDQSGTTGGNNGPFPGTASNSLALTGTTEGGVGVYPQGATHIQVSNVGTDTPIVGTILFLDQNDDTGTLQHGWQVCQQNSTSPACSANGNNNGRKMAGILREQVQAVTITAINGSTYTISPGLYAPNWTASRNPGAWWNISSVMCVQCGIRDLTFDHIASGPSITSAINIIMCYQCWVKNIRNIGSGGRNHLYVYTDAVGVIRDSYFEGSVGHTSGGGYMIDPGETSDFLIENNITDQLPSGVIVGENYNSTVIGYNFTWNNNPSDGMQISYPSHDPGCYFPLIEGNDLNGVSQDTQHGGCNASTYFRNHLPGQQPVPVDINNGGTQNQSPFELQAAQHGVNIVGNVLGMLKCSGGTFNGRTMDKASQCTGGTVGGSFGTNYEASPNTGITSPCYTSIYVAGWVAGCIASSNAFLDDTEVINESMRWGNCDTVTATCRFVNSEVPTTSSPFFNALTVPSSHTLPASFYYNAKPAWYQSAYGSTPWPPMGPDVTGGNLATLPAGTANEIPARLCYENALQDSTNYPSTTIIAFDANVCYPASGGSVTISPSSLSFGSVIVNVTSSSQTATLTNNSGSTITFTGNTLTTGTNFAIVGGSSCTGTLTAGNSCTVSVTFKPLSLGALSDTLNVAFTGAAGSPQQVSLSGTGISPGLPGGPHQKAVF